MRSVVIGLGFGDEGKGMVTSYLSSYYNNPLVVRYSGGHQAGHNVVNGKHSHTFANFGSGTLHGCPTYWSKHCTFDPIGFMNEYDILKEKVDDPIKIYIHRECPVTTPYERVTNQKFNSGHGTCGVGFGATISREENHRHFWFEDLFNSTILKIKIDLLEQFYNADKMLPDATPLMKHFAVALNDMFELFDEGIIEIVGDTDVPSHPNTIYESSQGLLLDQDIGFFPHVTRSTVGRKRLDNFIYHYDEVWYVTRAYQTRHGNGPMTNEKLNIINAGTETNETNMWQGDFRRGILDVDLLKYALQHDQRNIRRVQSEYLVITCLDQMVDWKFLENGGEFTFRDEDEFVENLIQALQFKGMVYLSRSPNDKIEQWKGGNYDDKKKV